MICHWFCLPEKENRHHNHNKTQSEQAFALRELLAPLAVIIHVPRGLECAVSQYQAQQHPRSRDENRDFDSSLNIEVHALGEL